MTGYSVFDIEKADEVDNGFPHPEGKCRIPKLACEAGHGNEHRSPERKQSSTQDEMAFGNDRIVAFAQCLWIAGCSIAMRLSCV